MTRTASRGDLSRASGLSMERPPTAYAVRLAGLPSSRPAMLREERPIVSYMYMNSRPRPQIYTGLPDAFIFSTADLFLSELRVSLAMYFRIFLPRSKSGFIGGRD